MDAIFLLHFNKELLIVIFSVLFSSSEPYHRLSFLILLTFYVQNYYENFLLPHNLGFQEIKD